MTTNRVWLHIAGAAIYLAVLVAIGSMLPWSFSGKCEDLPRVFQTKTLGCKV